MVTLMQESLLEQQLTDNIFYFATNFVGPAPGQGPSGVHSNALKKIGREYLTMWRALTGYRIAYNESLSVQYGSICRVLGDASFYLPAYVPTSIASRLLGARGFESW